MSDLGLSKESIKGLGPGAYLVNVLPSALLVGGVFAAVASRLYPWQHPRGDVSAGLDSLLAAVRSLGFPGGLLIIGTILFTAVVLRPFQISAVQWLEGYWHDRAATRLVYALAVERHHRRRGAHLVYSQEVAEQELRLHRFDAVARRERARLRRERRQDVSSAIVERQYPRDAERVMPTLLGNILRRAESVAGERYGLDTVETFPRLYPYLSPRLAEENETQLNVLDAAATLTIVFGTLATVTLPFLARLDAHGAIPLMLLMVAVVSYRGACAAAQRHSVVLAAAFDLHRFDMLAAMRRRMPRNARQEYADNEVLTRVLGGDFPAEQKLPWNYVHPDPYPPETPNRPPG
ncbi:hypothetical protein [Paractinoplanes brasiliensis]|uniref:Uncharacterized protein n=1 Tax=Paractinoplanes brasiliensis TaxID=52695 RepID=A0A4R6K1W1_9ACTN|nr:hypothetical protein [Actinoplanes brasiliensis]TDO42292.1 hypothetical protein C8E87_6059 [Actinoplanes brasiliensis]GID29519.1 hypothetical protein Abr02nite_45020 [Actinoplanes brasiliensis]